MKKTTTASVTSTKLTDEDIRKMNAQEVLDFYANHPDAPILLDLTKEKAMEIAEGRMRENDNGLEENERYDTFKAYRDENNQFTDLKEYVLLLCGDLATSKLQYVRENGEVIKTQIEKVAAEVMPDTVKVMKTKYILSAFNINLNAFFDKIKPETYSNYESANKLDFETPTTEGRVLDGSNTISERIEKYNQTRVKYQLINDNGINELESITDEVLEAFQIDPDKFKTLIGKLIFARLELVENGEVIKAMNETDEEMKGAKLKDEEPEDFHTASGFKPITRELKERFLNELLAKKWGNGKHSVSLNFIGSKRNALSFRNLKNFWMPIIKYWHAVIITSENNLMYKATEEQTEIIIFAKRLLKEAIDMNPRHDNINDAKKVLASLEGFKVQETKLDFE